MLSKAVLSGVVLLSLAIAGCMPVAPPATRPGPEQGLSPAALASPIAPAATETAAATPAAMPWGGLVPVPGPTPATTEPVDLSNVQPKTFTPELMGQLEGYIVDAMKLARVPGAAVAIVQNGQVVYLKGFGVREMGKGDPVTPDTLMMIGSIGKTMTTMMMATLVDEGRMAWGTPAIKILPGFAVANPTLTPEITMRNLVCACTGVPRRDLELLFNAGSLTAEDIVASLRSFQFSTGFGEAFQYSNQMAASGGYIAALAGSGGASAGDMYSAYLEQMQRRVFDPIGMAHTTFRFEAVAAAPDHATPHGENIIYEISPLPLSLERLLIPVGPAGASWSTARDMARYLITELNRGVSPDGVRVVSAENLGVTWQPQVAVSAAASYGLGWFVGKYKGLPLLYHGGNTLGFTSDLAFLPGADLGIVVLTNAGNSNAFTEAIHFRLFELAFGQPAEHDLQFKLQFKYQMKRMQNPEVKLEPGADPEQVAPYLRAYANPALGDITLSMRDGRLMLDAGEFAVELRRRVDNAGENLYVAYSAPLTGVSFEFKPGAGPGGKPTILLLMLPDNYTFTAK